MTPTEARAQGGPESDAPAARENGGGWTSSPTRSWATAYVRAVVVFVYFAVATVWLPSTLIGSATDESSRDIIVSATWAIAFGGGLWGLRELQRRGWL